MERNLLNRGGPGERKAEKDNKEERTPKIPIPHSLARILSIRIRKHNQLQITYNSRYISFHSIPNRLSESVWARTKGRRPNVVVVNDRRRGRWGLRNRSGLGGRRGDVRGNERRGGNGDGSTRWARGFGREDGRWAGIY